jgi:hypothetical protein
MIAVRAQFAHLILLAFALCAASTGLATPAVLVNSGHAATYLIADFAILHPELNSANGLSTIDNTCGTATTAAGCASNQSFDFNIIADTQNTSLQNVNVCSAP